MRPERRWWRVLGWALMVFGALTNTWTLGPLLSPDGRIEGTMPLVLISLASLFQLVLGALIAFRDPGRLRTDLTNGAVVIGTLLVCSIVAEAALRLTMDGEAAPSLALFEANAGGLSYGLRPNLATTSRIGDVEIRIRTNRHGMHWRDVDHEPPAGKTRIAFVGDSFTFGAWTDSVENSFVGVLESQIDTTRYEVLNFGVPGYGLGDVARQLRDQVLSFKPDVVFLMFYNGNDIRDTYLGPTKYRIVDGMAVWDSAVVAPLLPNALQPDPLSGPLSREGRELAVRLFRLRLYQLASGAAALARAEQDFTATHSMNDYPFWSRTEYPEVAKRALGRTLATLDSIAELTDSAGARLAVAAIPFREQVYARQERGEGYDVRLPQLHVERLAAQRGIQYLDLLPVLRASAKGSGRAPLYWKFDVHLTPEGHQVVGGELTKFFTHRIAPLAAARSAPMDSHSR